MCRAKDRGLSFWHSRQGSTGASQPPKLYPDFHSETCSACCSALTLSTPAWRHSVGHASTGFLPRLLRGTLHYYIRRHPSRCKCRLPQEATGQRPAVSTTAPLSAGHSPRAWLPHLGIFSYAHTGDVHRDPFLAHIRTKRECTQPQGCPAPKPLSL